jgi:alkylhydroperoxidase family enzyme
MAHLPYLDPATASEEVRETLARLPRQLNVFRMMAHAETNFRPLIRFGTAILGQQKLSAKLRELAILRVAQQSPARYEWVQHVPIAKAVGASEAQVAALERGDIAAACFDADEQLVLRFTSELVRAARPSDAVRDAVIARFSPQEVVELVFAVGFYMMMARLMETSGVDLEPDAGTTIIDAVARQTPGARKS